MEIQPFFSICIPVYNKEQYVRRCISSVLNQTFQDFEIIVVCDPSTDKSNKEVSKFKSPQIRVFYRHKPGPGGYAARNLAINKARGKWILFLDSDDLYYPTHLENFWRLSIEYPTSKLLASSKIIEESGHSSIDKFSSVQISKNKVFSFLDYLKFSVLVDKPFNMNSVGIHRSLMEDIIFFPDGRTSRSGDIYAWVHVTSRARSFVWSRHIGSHTHKDVVGVSKLNAPSILLFQEMVKELRESCNPLEYLWLRRYANRLIRIAFFEQRRILGKTEMELSKAFFWMNDYLYCLSWTAISFLPIKVIKVMSEIKKRLKVIKINGRVHYKFNIFSLL